jgi:hypothetical protein
MLTKTGGQGITVVIYGDNPVSRICEQILDNSLNVSVHDLWLLQEIAERSKKKPENSAYVV